MNALHIIYVNANSTSWSEKMKEETWGGDLNYNRKIK